MEPSFADRLSWPKIEALAKAGALALVPIGSTEAHGPHLPLAVDVKIAEAVCTRVARKHAGPVVIFPAVAYSLTDFAASFSGTVSLSAPTAEAFLTEVLAGIAKHGFKTVAAINHHLEPDHFRVVHRAAKQAAAQSGARIFAPDHRRPPFGEKLGEEFMHGGSHAGEYETSLMLAIAPDWVDEKERAKLADLPVDLPARIKAGAKNFEACGGKDAYFGTPRSATAARGEALLELLVDYTLQSLTQQTS